ncbi:MAG: hypothetical protein IJ659_05290 [Alloprevotella sp.]|nr:hypothetical protein [Alloprevotella sp.]
MLHPWTNIIKKNALGALLLCLSLLPAASLAQHGHGTPTPPHHGQPGRTGHPGNGSPGQPDERPPFNPQKFRRDFEDFVTKRAGLTAAEAKAFYPQFHKMKSQEREIRSKIKRILARARTEKLKLADSQRLLREVLRLRRQASDLEQRSYDQFSRILPADKLMRVMEAERAFGREMFRKGPHGGGGRK